MGASSTEPITKLGDIDARSGSASRLFCWILSAQSTCQTTMFYQGVATISEPCILCQLEIGWPVEPAVLADPPYTRSKVRMVPLLTGDRVPQFRSTYDHGPSTPGPSTGSSSAVPATNPSLPDSVLTKTYHVPGETTSSLAPPGIRLLAL